MAKKKKLRGPARMRELGQVPVTVWLDPLEKQIITDRSVSLDIPIARLVRATALALCKKPELRVGPFETCILEGYGQDGGNVLL